MVLDNVIKFSYTYTPPASILRITSIINDRLIKLFRLVGIETEVAWPRSLTFLNKSSWAGIQYLDGLGV